jgi:hypothetical protein
VAACRCRVASSSERIAPESSFNPDGIRIAPPVFPSFGVRSWISKIRRLVWVSPWACNGRHCPSKSRQLTVQSPQVSLIDDAPLAVRTAPPTIAPRIFDLPGAGFGDAPGAVAAAGPTPCCRRSGRHASKKKAGTGPGQDLPNGAAARHADVISGGCEWFDRIAKINSQKRMPDGFCVERAKPYVSFCLVVALIRCDNLACLGTARLK